MTFGEAAQGWHDFYVTAGAAAATLVGLLFVGLSLHIRVVVSHPDVRSLARVTLTDFFLVLLVALLMLTPTQAPATAAAWLVVIAIISLGIVFRPAMEAIRNGRRRAIRPRVLIARFGLSALCTAGLAVAGVSVSVGDVQDSLLGILAVVVVLLTVAVRNTWDLLVTVADRPVVRTEQR